MHTLRKNETITTTNYSTENCNQHFSKERNGQFFFFKILINET